MAEQNAPEHDSELVAPAAGGDPFPSFHSSAPEPAPAGHELRTAWSKRRYWMTPIFALLGAAGWKWTQPPPMPAAPVAYVAQASIHYAAKSSDRPIAIPHELTSYLYNELATFKEPANLAHALAPDSVRAKAPWLAGKNLDDVSIQKSVAARLSTGAIPARIIPDGQTIRFESADSNPASAAAVCNALTDAFVAQCAADPPAKNDDGLVASLARQMSDSKQSLDDLRKRENELRRTVDVSDLAPRRASLAQELDKLSTSRASMEQDRQQALARSARLDSDSADGLAEQFEQIKQQRIASEKEKDKLYHEAFLEQVAASRAYTAQRASGKTEQHRDVIIAAERLQLANQVLAQREKEVIARVTASTTVEKADAAAAGKVKAIQDAHRIEQQIADLDKRVADLKSQQESIDAEILGKSSKRPELEQVQADIQTQSKTADQLNERYTAALSQVKPQANLEIRISRRATGETSAPPAPPPVWQRPGVAQWIWCGGGTVLGLVMTFFTGGFRRRAATVSPIEAVLRETPMLASIPFAAGGGDRQIVQLHVAESFRQLRNSLLNLMASAAPGETNVIAITSARRGDGRSCVAAGLSIALAKSGRRVLLVDADLRQPTQHRTFGASQSPGLAELIEGQADPTSAIVAAGIDKLSLLRAGAPTVDPGQLLSWPDIYNYLLTVGRRFDFIVLDMAPVLENADASLLLSCCKGALLVLDTETPRPQLEQTLATLRELKARLIGAVRNRA